MHKIFLLIFAAGHKYSSVSHATKLYPSCRGKQEPLPGSPRGQLSIFSPSLNKEGKTKTVQSRWLQTVGSMLLLSYEVLYQELLQSRVLFLCLHLLWGGCK